MNWTTWVGIGSIYSALAVAGGALGAHFLKAHLTPERLMSYETAIRYQMYHGLALILIGLIMIKVNDSMVKYSAMGIAIGTLLFSGSIYILIANGPRILGPVTPLGGLMLIISWFLLATAMFRLSS